MADDYKVCRLCLKHTENEVPVDKKMTVIKALKDIFNIQLYDPKKTYPRLVCPACVSKVVDLYEYYLEIMTNQTKLILGIDCCLVAVNSKPEVESLESSIDHRYSDANNIRNSTDKENSNDASEDEQNSEPSLVYSPPIRRNSEASMTSHEELNLEAGDIQIPNKRTFNCNDLNNHLKTFTPKRLCLSTSDNTLYSDHEQLLIEDIDLTTPNPSQESCEPESNVSTQKTVSSLDDPLDPDYVLSESSQDSSDQSLVKVSKHSSNLKINEELKNISSVEESAGSSCPKNNSPSAASDSSKDSCASDVEITAIYRTPKQLRQSSIINFFMFK